MIITEPTPNPDSLKFLSEKTISEAGTEEFQKKDLDKIENQFVNLYKKSSSKKNHEFLTKNNFEIYKNFIHPLMIFSDCLYKRKEIK